MYTLELLGFLSYDRRVAKTLEEARILWASAKKETNQVWAEGSKREVRWSNWELYQTVNTNRVLVKKGEF